VRAAGVRFVSALFPGTHVPARAELLLAAGDGAGEVRDEARRTLARLQRTVPTSRARTHTHAQSKRAVTATQIDREVGTVA
jgi:hypothetical protein